MTLETITKPTSRDLTAKVVGNIFQNGLLSAAQLQGRNDYFLPSVDIYPCEDVQGHVLLPEADFADIVFMLYPYMNSIFPVVTERKTGMKWPENEQVASDRAQASFLVLAPVNQLETFTENIINDSSDAGNGLAFPDGVRNELFSHLIFPERVYAQLQQATLPGAQTVVIEESVRRFLYRKNKVPSIVPDYEGFLRRFVKTINKPFWMHAVRLPTDDDLNF